MTLIKMHIIMLKINKNIRKIQTGNCQLYLYDSILMHGVLKK